MTTPDPQKTTSKTTLRQKIREQRQQVNAEKRSACAVALVENLRNASFFQSAENIAFYWAHNSEIDTAPLRELAWHLKKICYLPVLHPAQSKHLCFIKYEPEDALINNRYEIPEPVFNSTHVMPPEQLDLVFTPLVSFDIQGNRLGQGVGYYDRTFAFRQQSKRPLLVGLAYDFQETPHVPTESWDVRLDAIVTETRLILLQR